MAKLRDDLNIGDRVRVFVEDDDQWDTTTPIVDPDGKTVGEHQRIMPVITGIVRRVYKDGGCSVMIEPQCEKFFIGMKPLRHPETGQIHWPLARDEFEIIGRTEYTY